MIEKIMREVAEEKRMIASFVVNSKALNKKDKNLSKCGLSDKQIENFDYEKNIDEYIQTYSLKKIIDNTTEEMSFQLAWKKLSFADRNDIVEKLRLLGELELAGRLSEKTVMFYDIQNVSDSVIKKLLEQTDYNELTRAMVDLKETYSFFEDQKRTKEKIFSNMDLAKLKELQEDLYFLGPIRRKDVLKSRCKICQVLKSLVS